MNVVTPQLPAGLAAEVAKLATTVESGSQTRHALDGSDPADNNEHNAVISSRDSSSDDDLGDLVKIPPQRGRSPQHYLRRQSMGQQTDAIPLPLRQRRATVATERPLTVSPHASIRDPVPTLRASLDALRAFQGTLQLDIHRLGKRQNLAEDRIGDDAAEATRIIQAVERFKIVSH